MKPLLSNLYLFVLAGYYLRLGYVCITAVYCTYCTQHAAFYSLNQKVPKGLATEPCSSQFNTLLTSWSRLVLLCFLGFCCLFCSAIIPSRVPVLLPSLIFHLHTSCPHLLRISPVSPALFPVFSPANRLLSLFPCFFTLFASPAPLHLFLLFSFVILMK